MRFHRLVTLKLERLGSAARGVVFLHKEEDSLIVPRDDWGIFCVSVRNYAGEEVCAHV